MIESFGQQQAPAHSRLLSCTRFVSDTTNAKNMVILANQSIRLHTRAKRQKLRRASNELNIPKAKAKLVANDVTVISGPALDSDA